MAAQAFSTTARPLLNELKDHLKTLEIGKTDSTTMWLKVGQGLRRKKAGKPLSQQRCQGLWNEMLEGKIRPDPEIIEVVAALAGRDDFVLGALSNVIAEHFQLLDQMNVYQPFEVCILSFQVGMRKPDKKIYRLAASTAGVETRECLFIDDSATNVAGAEKAGMVAHHYEEPEGLKAFLSSHGLL